MDVVVTSAILASVVCLTVAIAIFIRRPRRPLYTHFGTFSVALFAWHAASVANHFGQGSIGRVQTAAALFIPPTAFMFFRELLRPTIGLRTRAFARVAMVLSSLLLLLTLSPWGKSLAVQLMIATYVMVSMAIIQRGLFSHIKRARTETDRKRLKYLFYGGLATLFLALGEFFPNVMWVAATGHVAVTFYVYFLYQSIVARRLIDLVELLSKTAVLAALTFLLAAVYALLVLWVGSNRQGLWLFNTLVASFVILILYDQVRPWIEETTAKMLFREHYELRQVIRRLLRALRTTISVEDMRDLVLNALHTSGRASQAAMYLAGDVEMSFSLFGYRGTEPPQNLSLAQQPALLQEMRRLKRPMLLEHLTHRQGELPTLLTSSDPTLQREMDRNSEAIATMRLLSASVVIPMLIEDRITGILTLGAEHLAETYSTDELATLLSLAEACAAVIENSHEYEKRRERDRLVAIGEMSAGMAHEIRNPLGAIKGAAQCLDPQTLPVDAREFIDVIIEEVDRLNGVVGQFLEYARPLRGNPMLTDVNKVISATVRLLERDSIPGNVQIKQELSAQLPTIFVDPEQLKQVLINLVLNAITAMPNGGTITLTSSKSDHLLIRVRDTGEGIRPEHLSRIFVPFFTTKAHGTGLGLAISQRIMENANGRLEVSSRLGYGTTFTLRLPLNSDGAKSTGRI